MENEEESKPDKFTQLQNKVTEDLKIRFETIKEHLQTNISLHHYYITLLLNEKKKLQELTNSKNKLYGALYNFYRFKSEKLLKSTEIEYYIKKHSDWIKLINMLNEQELIVDYLEHIDKLFNSRAYTLSKLADLKKHEET